MDVWRLVVVVVVGRGEGSIGSKWVVDIRSSAELNLLFIWFAIRRPLYITSTLINTCRCSGCIVCGRSSPPQTFTNWHTILIGEHTTYGFINKSRVLPQKFCTGPLDVGFCSSLYCSIHNIDWSAISVCIFWGSFSFGVYATRISITATTLGSLTPFVDGVTEMHWFGRLVTRRHGYAWRRLLAITIRGLTGHHYVIQNSAYIV